MHVYIHKNTAQKASEGPNRPLYHLIFPSVLLPLITFMHFTSLLTFYNSSLTKISLFN